MTAPSVRKRQRSVPVAASRANRCPSSPPKKSCPPERAADDRTFFGVLKRQSFFSGVGAHGVEEAAVGAAHEDPALGKRGGAEHPAHGRLAFHVIDLVGDAPALPAAAPVHGGRGGRRASRRRRDRRKRKGRTRSRSGRNRTSASRAKRLRLRRPSAVLPSRRRARTACRPCCRRRPRRPRPRARIGRARPSARTRGGGPSGRRGRRRGRRRSRRTPSRSRRPAKTARNPIPRRTGDPGPPRTASARPRSRGRAPSPRAPDWWQTRFRPETAGDDATAPPRLARQRSRPLPASSA